MVIYYFACAIIVFNRRNTMAGCVLMAGVMLLYLIAVMRQNAYVAAEDDSDTTKQLYFV